VADLGVSSISELKPRKASTSERAVEVGSERRVAEKDGLEESEAVNEIAFAANDGFRTENST